MEKAGNWRSGDIAALQRGHRGLPGSSLIEMSLLDAIVEKYRRLELETWQMMRLEPIGPLRYLTCLEWVCTLRVLHFECLVQWNGCSNGLQIE